MKLPLIIAEGIDLSFYDDVESAEGSMDGVDVEYGDYVGYDAQGRKLRITATGVQRFGITIDIGQTHVALDEDEPNHSQELRALMREYLRFLGRPGPRYGSLEELIAACREPGRRRR